MSPATDGFSAIIKALPIYSNDTYTLSANGANPCKWRQSGPNPPPCQRFPRHFPRHEAIRPLQFQGLGGAGAGGFKRSSVRAWSQPQFLAPDDLLHHSITPSIHSSQVSESRSATERSLLLGFSMAYSRSEERRAG